MDETISASAPLEMNNRDDIVPMQASFSFGLSFLFIVQLLYYYDFAGYLIVAYPVCLSRGIIIILSTAP